MTPDLKKPEPENNRSRVVGLIVIVALAGFILTGFAFHSVVNEKSKPVMVTPTPTPVADDDEDDRGCLDGKTGVIVALFTEKLQKENGYTWETSVSFNTGDGLIITRVFEGSKLDEIWKPGMKMRTQAGERTIGSYDTPNNASVTQ